MTSARRQGDVCSAAAHQAGSRSTAAASAWAPANPQPAFRISPQLLAVQLLTGQGIAALLLAVHERLQQACPPRHKLQAMACMRAVVRLLGPRVTSPPVFKYLTHILLQQVQVRSAT